SGSRSQRKAGRLATGFGRRCGGANSDDEIRGSGGWPATGVIPGVRGGIDAIRELAYSVGWRDCRARTRSGAIVRRSAGLLGRTPMRLAYSDEGPGPAVVLLHGFPLSRAMWVPQVSGVGSIYRIIAPDLRGHGDSPSPEGVYTMDEMADDVIELLDTLH